MKRPRARLVGLLVVGVLVLVVAVALVQGPPAPAPEASGSPSAGAGTPASGAGASTPPGTAPPRPSDTAATAQPPSTAATALPPDTPGQPAFTGAGCHAGDPLAGVYNPQRLAVLDPCRTVTGVVDCIRKEADGDSHIRMTPDDPSLLTPANAQQTCPGHPGPHLVIEIIPQHCGGVAQRDAEDNCADRVPFTTPVYPAPGGRYTVVGPYVLDHQHGDWAEIHPAEVVRAGG